jgi:hypothetical protein
MMPMVSRHGRKPRLLRISKVVSIVWQMANNRIQAVSSAKKEKI